MLLFALYGIILETICEFIKYEGIACYTLQIFVMSVPFLISFTNNFKNFNRNLFHAFKAL
jgi:hypothetical protein